MAISETINVQNKFGMSVHGLQLTRHFVGTKTVDTAPQRVQDNRYNGLQWYADMYSTTIACPVLWGQRPVIPCRSIVEPIGEGQQFAAHCVSLFRQTVKPVEITFTSVH